MAAKLTRSNQRPFGSTATSGQIRQFGSLANGTPLTTVDPDLLQALSQFLAGWKGAVIGNNSPAIEDVNALFYLAFYQLRYAFQEGIPEWDDEAEYFIGSLINDSTNGIQRRSIVDNSINNATSDVTKWGLPISQGLLSKDSSITSVTVPSGYTLSQPYLNIQAAHTYIIAGNLLVQGPLTVAGTLTISGTSRVLS